jgi:hypothetical protein
MVTKRAVVMATKVVGKVEGDCKSGKSNGDGNEEGYCKEEGDGKQQRQQDNGNRDNNDVVNTTMTTTMLMMMTKTMAKMAKTTVRRRRLAVAGSGRGGQQTRQRRGLSVHIFHQNWILGVVGCWQGTTSPKCRTLHFGICRLQKRYILLS